MAETMVRSSSSERYASTASRSPCSFTPASSKNCVKSACRTSGPVRDSTTRSVRYTTSTPASRQALGEGVVFRLRLLEIGNIVKQQPLQILRHEIFQFLSRPVQQDLPQPPDLRGIMDSCFHTITPFRNTPLGFLLFPISCVPI